MCFYWIGIALFYFVSTRFSLMWKKASINELRVEDSVLLEGIGVLQGTLFIYLSLSEELILSSIHLNLLRWSIPFVTILFFVLRGYGAIKNSPKYRLYSSLILIYYLTFEAVFLFNEFVSFYLPIYVNSTNIIPLYLPSSAGFVLLSFVFEIHNALSVRYGHK